MLHKFYKVLLIIGIVLTLTAIPAFWYSYAAPQNLEVDYLDVGQGDAILIKTPYSQNILIDGGPDNSVIKEMGKNLAWWDKRIDLMILTHPHDDHVTGLIDVIKRFKVKKILYTGVVHTSPNYLEWLELIRERNIPMIIIDRPQIINLGEESNLNILYPRESMLGKEVSNINNSSMIVKLVYGETEFLFSGDAELEVEEELLALTPGLTPTAFLTGEGIYIDLTAQVFKAGHHGSDTSNSEELLNAIMPEIVVIQVGADNDFGHPSRRVLKRLGRLGAQVFRNDLDGTVRVVSDGFSVEKF
ncbi:MAG: MBL fold metallo-hydrolase [Patescibacteria group bacterium]